VVTVPENVDVADIPNEPLYTSVTFVLTPAVVPDAAVLLPSVPSY